MDINSLAHTKWNCKYHIVFAPKYRRKIIYGQLKRDIANILLSVKLDAPAPCRLDASDLDLICYASADCLHFSRVSNQKTTIA